MGRPVYVRFLYLALILAVYVLGLIVPLFDNDSAHHALIGMHMYLTGNFVELIDRGRDYLDKPHMLFWLSAVGDMMLGIGTLSYKLPSLLLAIPGVFATFRLAERLYSRRVAWHAVVILISTQAYILAHNDVRMDALLLSFIITATWLLYELVCAFTVYRLLFASLFLALAFATKGMSGVAVPVIAVGSQVLYSRNWQFIKSGKWLLVVPFFFVFISPVLYCYYLQFDLHPEKVIRGMSGISGVAFILFFQNTERLQGVNWGASGSKDPFLFFHSLLWALLPWCLLGYWAVFRKAKFLVKSRFRFDGKNEVLSWATIVIMFTILTSSNFRLPHYLNILFPFFAMLIAGELEQVRANSGESGFLAGMQKFVAVVMVALGVVINSYFFPAKPLIALLSLPALYLLIQEWRAQREWLGKLVAVSLCSSLFTNILMNGSFYPQIQKYQAGKEIAETIDQLGIPADHVYLADWESPTLNYYAQHFFKKVDSGTTLPSGDYWLVGPEEHIRKWTAGKPVREGEHYEFLFFSTTNLKPAFVNPKTRAAACTPIRLVHLKAGKIR